MVKRLILLQEKFTIIKKLKISRLEEKMSWKACKVFELWPFKEYKTFARGQLLSAYWHAKFLKNSLGRLSAYVILLKLKRKLETLKGKEKRVCKIKGVNL